MDTKTKLKNYFELLKKHWYLAPILIIVICYYLLICAYGANLYPHKSTKEVLIVGLAAILVAILIPIIVKFIPEPWIGF